MLHAYIPPSALLHSPLPSNTTSGPLANSTPSSVLDQATGGCCYALVARMSSLSPVENEREACSPWLFSLIFACDLHNRIVQIAIACNLWQLFSGFGDGGARFDRRHNCEAKRRIVTHHTQAICASMWLARCRKFKTLIALGLEDSEKVQVLESKLKSSPRSTERVQVKPSTQCTQSESVDSDFHMMLFCALPRVLCHFFGVSSPSDAGLVRDVYQDRTKYYLFFPSSIAQGHRHSQGLHPTAKLQIGLFKVHSDSRYMRAAQIASGNQAHWIGTGSLKRAEARIVLSLNFARAGQVACRRALALFLAATDWWYLTQLYSLIDLVIEAHNQPTMAPISGRQFGRLFVSHDNGLRVGKTTGQVVLPTIRDKRRRLARK
ncbi:hypothetical protein B0H13DRAFT_1850621 [Mycena leptocephala]|nr:hypothetical protein B0H13DRAFT_1850621 [Mycena leptocephala]